MQVFRIMDLPDKVIAFDELPERMLEGFEMIRAEGFPNYWKKWMGTIKRKIKVTPERDPETRKMIYFDPILEEDCFFYLVDPGIKPVMDKWKSVEEYVRRKVSPEFRLTDRLEDMAKPLAKDKTEGLSLEPDDVIIIPLPKETPVLVDQKGLPTKTSSDESTTVKCDQCDKEYDGVYAKNALRLHKNKKHAKEVVAA